MSHPLNTAYKFDLPTLKDTRYSNEYNREFLFTDNDFNRIKDLIALLVGISLTSAKKDMVYVRLSRRLRALNFTTFNEYLNYAEHNMLELEQFTNSLTTNLTAFFREYHHFPILQKQLQSIKSRPIRLWCAAASTGEEAYSMAISAAEILGLEQCKNRISIIASDVDTSVLKTAKKGIYQREHITKIAELNSDEILKKYFLYSNKNNNIVSVKPELKQLITFKQINLLDNHWTALNNAKFDAIFCRNVMIYFTKELQLKILRHLVEVMQPDGLLFVGHSENFLNASDILISQGKTVYKLKNNKIENNK